MFESSHYCFSHQYQSPVSHTVLKARYPAEGYPHLQNRGNYPKEGHPAEGYPEDHPHLQDRRNYPKEGYRAVGYAEVGFELFLKGTPP